MTLVAPSPPTPVLLYLGAGYDLSPLLTFSPNPPRSLALSPPATYSSFLFADAKPRHTSAFMVSDFDQWIDVPSRVRNVIRYAQGILDRWRLVDSDLIWFEGGGSPSHLAQRRADSAWNFVQPPASTPLVTLIYAFNTLDIELARLPALARVWPHVAALYVHGLRPHPTTGLDRLIIQRLQHVYVIVGSWGTPTHGRAHGAGAQQGVRHVDFVKANRRHWRKQAPDYSDPCSHSDIDSDADSDSPVVFLRPRSAWCDSDTEQCSDDYSDDPSSPVTPPIHSTFSLPRFTTIPISRAPRPRPTFYTRIPQIAWDDALNDGRGGYYVSKTVQQSLAIWRARGDGPLETESEDSADELLDPPGDDGPPPTLYNTPTEPHPHPPPRLRPRPAAKPVRQPFPLRHVNSASSTDVSDDEDENSPAPPHSRRPFPFWRRRTTSLSNSSPAPEGRIALADFLRSPSPPGSPLPPSAPYARPRCTHSCPELKDTTNTTLSNRSFQALRALATIGRNRLLDRGAPPPPAQPPPPPLSRPSGGAGACKKKNTKAKVRGVIYSKMPRELRRLIPSRTTTRAERDNCESDVTRVD